ncbi:MAG: Gfo/Idh/MocA family oxidoreductase [Rhodospirillales bacterium]
MTGEAPLDVAVIGCGYFAGFHIEAWQRIPRVRLAATVDNDIARAEGHGCPAWSDARAMLPSVAPDIVDIAAPPAAHADLIALAVEAGVKTIICQKPFCGDIDTARKATRRAADAGIPLIVHENFRFQPWYRALKAEIAGGAIGDLMQITFRLRPGDGMGERAYLDRQPYFQEMPRFLVHETGVHFIDVFRFLAGEPDWVNADLRRLNPVIAGEDAGTFTFGYESGLRAMFDGNRLLDHAADNPRLTMGEAVVEGTEGEIRLSGDGELTLRRRGEKAFNLIFHPENTDRFGGDCVYQLQSHVVANLLDGAPLENIACSYLRVMELESLIYQSAASGSRVPAGQAAIA